MNTNRQKESEIIMMLNRERQRQEYHNGLFINSLQKLKDKHRNKFEEEKVITSQDDM